MCYFVSLEVLQRLNHFLAEADSFLALRTKSESAV